MTKTYSLKSTDVTRKWYVIDAEGKPLGRIAAKAARILMGKHKPEYTPHIDNGDFVVIVNCGKLVVTGRKANTKFYHHHSGYPGGLKSTVFKDMIQRKPEFPIRHAIKGMLPKNRLARKMIQKLHIFERADHPFDNVETISLDI